MGKGGATDWMRERERDRSERAWRRKHSKERESGVSEWKSAGVSGPGPNKRVWR